MFPETIMIVTEEEREGIKRQFQKTDEEINEYIRTLREWFKKQPHLPQNEEDAILLKTLICNKFSLEKTKRKLDMFYSVRNLFPEYFENREPLHPSMQLYFDTVIMVQMPRLTEDYHRVVIVKYYMKDPVNFNVVTFIKYIMMVSEIYMRYDCKIGNHIIIDNTNATVANIAKLTPTELKQCIAILQNAYSDRVIGIHNIRNPKYATTLMSLLKAVFNKKISNRVYVHDDLESLYKHVPKNVLPKDFGGPERTLKELHSDIRVFVESHNSWIKERAEMKSNEKLRVGEPINTDMFGIQGSFRQLQID
ncbi:uncharacterized protein CBL_02495 [Carabus blaptoides fortunei]